MTTKKYTDATTLDEILVEEMTRKEALEYTQDFINSIEAVSYSTDLYIWVEYKDGSYYCNMDGDVSGVFKRQNIKGVILDDGYEYYVYGAYKMNEVMLPELI